MKIHSKIMLFLILPVASSFANSLWAFFISFGISTGGSFLSVFQTLYAAIAIIGLVLSLVGFGKIGKPSAVMIITTLLYATAVLTMMSVLNYKNVLAVYAFLNVDVIIFALTRLGSDKIKETFKSKLKLVVSSLVLMAGILYMYVSVDQLTPGVVTPFVLLIGISAGVLYGAGGAAFSKMTYERTSMPHKIFWIGALETVFSLPLLIFVRSGLSSVSAGYALLAGLVLFLGLLPTIVSFTATMSRKKEKRLFSSELVYALSNLDILGLLLLYYVFVKPVGVQVILSVIIISASIWYMYRSMG